MGKDGLPLVAPELQIDETLAAFWVAFWDVSNSVARIKDGVAFPIPPSEWFYWSKLTDTTLSNEDYGILRAMDVAFCEQMNIELGERQARHEAEVRTKR